MLLNWDVENVCIVSSQWHIRTTFDMIASLLAVVLIGVGYEALRAASRKYELAVTKRVDSAPSKSGHPSSSLPPLFPVLPFLIPPTTPQSNPLVSVYPCVSFIPILCEMIVETKGPM